MCGMEFQLMPNAKIPVEVFLAMALQQLPGMRLRFGALNAPHALGRMELKYDVNRMDYTLQWIPMDGPPTGILEPETGAGSPDRGQG